MFKTIGLIMLFWLAPSVAMSVAGGSVAHELTVDIQPERNEIRVKDRITLPPGVSELVLTGQARRLASQPPGVREERGAAVRRLFIPDSLDPRAITLDYALPLGTPGAGRAEPGASGILRDGSGPWYAHAPGRLLTFTLTATTPARWHAVSQGERLSKELADGRRRVVWRETQPQQEAYLIAAPFTEYLREYDGLQAMVFLRRPDEELADKYLGLTARYVDMYENMIGAYPYAKFALVENDRETGFGMPSFTLLGPRVIRLPFIPYTSYPHEILHNWWGNSVYVDHSGGNWCEGLTSYLSDHWFKAQRGEGARYRRDALQKYMNFVSDEQDFPLTEFRTRHDEATQAVGYNKGLMLFHMLRKRVGDRIFFDALRRFYRDYRFREASFADLRDSFERTARRDLGRFFEQWLTRTGAPALSLDETRLASGDGRFIVRGRLRQTQPGAVYSLEVPVRVRTESGSRRRRITLAERELDFEFEIEPGERPVAVAVDPDFDVFRKLDIAEIPPSLGAAFGAARLTFVVPDGATGPERRAYQAFIESWRGPDRELRVITDRAPVPDSGAVWLLGWQNARRGLLESALQPYGVALTGDAIDLADKRHLRADHALVIAARLHGQRPLLWTHLAGADAAAMSRRVSHYSRVSYLAFKDGQPVSQGQWPVLDSPLTVELR